MKATLAILALAASAVPTAASGEPLAVSIKLSGSDLQSEASMRKRVTTAIEELCGSYAPVELSQWPDIDKCRHSAWRQANRQIAEIRSRREVRLGAR